MAKSHDLKSVSAAPVRMDPYEFTKYIDYLRAGLLAVCGGGFESFQTMDEKQRDDYLCMLHEIAEKAKTAANAYIEQGLANGKVR